MNVGFKVAKAMDFTCSQPSRNMMKGLYLGTIATRLALSRSQLEIRETLVRDIPGFLTFFYVAGIIQNVVGFGLDKLSKYGKNASTLIKGPGEGIKFTHMLNPVTKYKVRSFADIENLQGIISKKNFDLLMRNKAIANVIGIGTSIAVLGIFLTKLNVKMTRKKAIEEQKKAEANNGSSPLQFSSNVNFKIDPVLKPKTCQINLQA